MLNTKKPEFKDCAECQFILDNIEDNKKSVCGTCGRNVTDIYDMVNSYNEFIREDMLYIGIDDLSVFNIEPTIYPDPTRKPLNEIQIGDKVYLDCDSSLGASSCGVRTVDNVTVRYDESTGSPYNVIWCDDAPFDSRTGGKMDKWGIFYIESYEDVK